MEQNMSFCFLIFIESVGWTVSTVMWGPILKELLLVTELHSGVEIRCENCHGTPSKTPEAMLVIESDARTKRLLASNALNPNLKGKS